MRSLICLLCLPLLAGGPARAAMALTAEGVQIYTCAAQDGRFAWVLKAPYADLFDAGHHLAGHHGAGPVWRGTDGSAVMGEKLAESRAPAAGDIPWLVLRAGTHEGSGRFANVSYITRTQTEGGVAPRTGCNAAARGTELRQRYAAVYTFF